MVQRTTVQLRSSALDLCFGLSPAQDAVEQKELTDLQSREHYGVGKEVGGADTGNPDAVRDGEDDQRDDYCETTSRVSNRSST